MADHPPLTQAIALDRLWTGRARLLGVVASAAGPTEDGWTPAEHLAHVVAWQRRLLIWFEDDRLGRPVVRPEPGWTFDQTDAMNEHYHEATRGISIADARAAFDAAHVEVEALVRRLSDRDLTDPGRFLWLGYPAGDNIAGNSFGHYREHAEWLGG